MIDSVQLQQFDDVEVRVHAIGDGTYGTDIRIMDLGHFTSTCPPPGEYLRRATDTRSYGALLFQWLFKDEVREAFSYARRLTSEPSRGLGSEALLRFRLALDPQSA